MKTYNFLRFLQDKKSTLFVLLITQLLIFIVLHGLDTDISAIVLVLITCGVGTFLSWIIQYMSSKEFWQDMSCLKDEPMYFGDMKKPSGDIHTQLAMEALEVMRLSADQQIEELSQSSQDYREFIERWVHEIKTPLAAAGLILANNSGEVNSRLKIELDRVVHYVEQALYYARVGSVDKDLSVCHIQLKDLVKRAIKSRAHLLIETQTKVVIDDISHEVICDPKWIEFILAQIIDNAVKYQDKTKAESRLIFSEEVKGLGTADEHICLYIEDNGVGIDKADISRIFDKGFVGKNGREVAWEKSSGIGLYLAGSMCEKMNIDISCKSEKGEMTRICLGFPGLEDPSYKNVSFM